jgi:hypothetical protein
MDTWQMIKAERASLVDAVAALPDTNWSKPSLCAGWSVREVVADARWPVRLVMAQGLRTPSTAMNPCTGKISGGESSPAAVTAGPRIAPNAAKDSSSCHTSTTRIPVGVR